MSTLFPISAGVTAAGEPIAVRLFEACHAEELYRLTDSNRGRLREWLPWLDWSKSAADTANHIQVSYDRYLEKNGFSAGIWVGAKLAGASGVHAVIPQHRSSSIGYWLAEEFEGQGVMTRACRAVVDAAFLEYRLHRVEIRCATGNHKSRAIPERLGFTCEGVLREAEWLYDHFVDLVVYSVLEDEWRRVR